MRFFTLLSESLNISISLTEAKASSKELIPNGINFATLSTSAYGIPRALPVSLKAAFAFKVPKVII